MKTYFSLFLLSVMSICSVNAAVTAAEKPYELKVVESQKVLSEIKEGKEVEERLLKKRQGWEAKIKPLQDRMQKKAQEAESKAKANPNAKAEFLAPERRELERMDREMKALQEEAMGELRESAQAEMAALNKKFVDVVSELAKKEGWDTVAIKETGEIVYVSDRVNASNKLVEALNKQYESESARAKIAKPRAA